MTRYARYGLSQHDAVVHLKIIAKIGVLLLNRILNVVELVVQYAMRCVVVGIVQHGPAIRLPQRTLYGLVPLPVHAIFGICAKLHLVKHVRVVSYEPRIVEHTNPETIKSSINKHEYPNINRIETGIYLRSGGLNALTMTPR